MPGANLRVAGVGIGIVAVLLLPTLLGPFWAYQLGLYYLYAAGAVGIGLCWGQAGFLPLGQALFFGLAAYLSALLLLHGGDTSALTLLLPVIPLVVGVGGYGFARLAFRGIGESGPFFSMITLALALLAYQVANDWATVTGGYNGLKDIPDPIGVGDYDIGYYWCAAAMIAVLGVARWLYVAPIGVLWRALAQNERRVALLGFDVNRLKSVAYGVSAIFAAVGGVLYAPHQGLVAPQTIGFDLSASLVVWAAIGGRRSLVGPALGAAVIGTLSSELRDRFFYWEILMAGLFIIVVIALPEGMIGLARLLARRLQGSSCPVQPIPAPTHAAQDRTVHLVIDQATARLGAVTILDGLSLAFDRPGIACIIGPNGAGKTSTFNLITGELAPRQGKVASSGTDHARLGPHDIIRLGIGRKFQIPSVFPELTVADNLGVALWSGRASRLDLLRPRLKRWTTPMLEELRRRYPFLAEAGRTASALSHGERQLLELAMVLVTEPRLLLLDEPCAGLSPEETASVVDLIRWAQRVLGGAIVIIEHDMALVKDLADHVYVLHGGALLAQGTVDAVQADPAVRAVYVGSAK